MPSSPLQQTRPAASPPLTAAEEVHVARAIAADDERSLRQNVLCYADIDKQDGWKLVLLVGTLAIWSQWSAVGWVVGPVLIGLVVVFVAGLLWSYVPARFYGGQEEETEDAAASEPLADVSDPSRRVRYVATLSELSEEELRIIREIRERGATDASEPERLPILVVSESLGAMIGRAAVSLAVGAAVLAGVKLALRFPLTAPMLFTDLLVVACVARMAWGFVWPTYARVVPGRLDVLRYGMLGSGEPSVESFDLRTVRLLIADKGRIRLQRDSCDEGVWLSGQGEMGTAVLAAAFSRFAPPPLEERPHVARTRRTRLAAAPVSAQSEVSDPAPSPEPWLEPVHLAGMISEEDRRSLWRSPFRAFNIDLVPEWVAGAAVVALVGIGVGRASGVVDVGTLRIAGGIITVVAVVASIRHAASLTYSPHYPYESDPRHRLRVTGWGSVLPAAEGVIARARSTRGRDISEPETFRITHASEPPLELAFRAAACLTVAILGLLLIRALFAPRLPFGAPWVPMLLALAITRAVWGFLWSTVVRVAPGRLDVIRSPLLGLGRSSVTTYDLRSARVLIDLRYGRVFIQPAEAGPDGEGEWLSGVMGQSTDGGREMGLAVLAAALSSFNAPPAPELDAVDEVLAR